MARRIRTEDYVIGLDIGTNSVGWAVIGENYNLLKFKGKNMWGSRLFDEGQHAKDRRIKRTTRRRLQRRRQRITLLRMLMGDMIEKVDPEFYVKLDHSYMTCDDKGYHFTLFDEESMNDITYYDQYKTIYHLRKALCDNEEKMDPRLIYLALHHIIKYRGNFLYEGQSFNLEDSSNIQATLKEFLEHVFEINYEKCLENDTTSDFSMSISDELVSKLLELVCDKNKKKKDKEDEVKTSSDITDKAVKDLLLNVTKMLLGRKVQLEKIFVNREIKNEDGDKPLSISFEDNNYEELQDYIESCMDDEYYYLVLLNKVYSYSVLNRLIGKAKTISESMISKYDQHHEDLVELKALIRKYARDEYKSLFRDQSADNYECYVNGVENPTGKNKKPGYQEFGKKVSSILEKIKDPEAQEQIKRINDRIELDNYMPKQTTKDNGSIPYQLHLDELKMILEKQGKYYPALKENADKIISLLTFRIPYYVGPLNDQSSFAWIQRKSYDNIYPWNFEEVVDVEASAEKFITRMTGTCTYILGEPVLPRYSLLYTKYVLLNELNMIRINDKKLGKDLKNELIEHVFMKKKTVKTSDINKYCLAHGYSEVKKLEGTQKKDEFAASLAPWIDFKRIYGEEFEQYFDEIEQIIEWITIYNDQKILKRRIKKEFTHLDDNRINKIVKLKYSGWGRLCKKLLTGIRSYDKYGNPVTIMDMLEDKQVNFMQLISKEEYGFKKRIEEENALEDNSFTHATIRKRIEQLHGTPANKKAIYQANLIVEEIVKIMGKEPKFISIEFAREEQEKIRTKSRKDTLLKMYKEAQESGHDFDSYEQSVYERLKNEPGEINERVYLYYIQLGKCAYSGETLDFVKVVSGDYEVDHIIPRSLIPDDSIDNKVLVKRKYNQYKGANLVLPSDIIDSQFGRWKSLNERGLMSKKKFTNLIRREMSEKDELSFMNRQIVETRQIIKHVANLLQEQYKSSKVVAVRASLSHYFREKYNIYKIRELNDYHHAQDAYLACVIANFIMRKYPKLQNDFIFDKVDYSSTRRRDDERYSSDLQQYGYIISNMGTRNQFNKDTGELVWEGDKTLNRVRNTCFYKDCFITKKPEMGKGAFYNETLSKKPGSKGAGNEDKLISINKERADVTKYGGYTGVQSMYAVAVKYTKKKKIVKQLVNIPIQLLNASKDDILQYIKSRTDNSVKIIKDRILFKTLIEIDGCKLTISSAQEFRMFEQLLLSEKSQSIIYRLFNYESKKKMIKPTDEELMNVYDEIIEKIEKVYKYKKYALVAKILKNKRELFFDLEDKRQPIRDILKMLKTGSEVKFDKHKVINRIRIRNESGGFDINNIVFIHQSVTGMFEEKYKL